MYTVFKGFTMARGFRLLKCMPSNLGTPELEPTCPKPTIKTCQGSSPMPRQRKAAECCPTRSLKEEGPRCDFSLSLVLRDPKRTPNEYVHQCSKGTIYSFTSSNRTNPVSWRCVQGVHTYIHILHIYHIHIYRYYNTLTRNVVFYHGHHGSLLGAGAKMLCAMRLGKFTFSVFLLYKNSAHGVCLADSSSYASLWHVEANRHRRSSATSSRTTKQLLLLHVEVQPGCGFGDLIATHQPSP